MSIEDRVRTVVAKHLETYNVPPDRIVRDASLVNDLSCDSLDLIEISMSIEEEFAVEITDDEIEKLDTFGDFVALVEQRTA